MRLASKFKIAILLSALFYAGLNADAGPENKEIVFSMGTKGYPPYLVVNKYGGVDGIMMDVLREIASKFDFKVVVELLPSKRGDLYAEQGMIDVKARSEVWVQNPERFYWTDSVLRSIDSLIFFENNPLEFTAVEDLFGKNIGGILGYGYPMFEEHFKNNRINRIDTLSEREMINLVANERLDAAIINELVGLWIIGQDPELQKVKFRFSEKKVGDAPYQFMFTKEHNWQPFIEQFNKELKKMKLNGRLDEIIAKYVSKD